MSGEKVGGERVWDGGAWRYISEFSERVEIQLLLLLLLLLVVVVIVDAVVVVKSRKNGKVLNQAEFGLQ